MARQTFAAGAQPGNTGPAGAGGSGGNDEYTVNTTAAPGSSSLILNRAPVGWVARQGYIAAGVGGINCEINAVSAIASGTLTMVNPWHFQHAAGERLLFFGGMSVPMAWWGVPTGVDTVDGLDNLQAAMNALRSGYVSPAMPLTLDCQNKALYVSGPHYIPQNIGIENLRLHAMTGGLYTGPMDGPDHPLYNENAMSVLCQSLDRYTYDQATNLFQVVNAAGAAKSDTNISVNSPMIFGRSANGLTIPTGLIPGRMYSITEKPSASTFRLGLLPGGSTISFSSNGAGFAGGQAGVDNCKFYGRNIHIDGRKVGEIAITADPATSVITAASAHGLSVGDKVRFNIPAVSVNLPVPLEEGIREYFVQSVPSATTFKVSDTDGGAAITITDAGDGGFFVNCRNALNGALWAMQQNSYTEHIRIDGCKGFGVRIRSQQSHWQNAEFINNGTAIVVGEVDKSGVGHGANFIYISTVNTEQQDCRSMLVRAVCPDIHFRDVHLEEGGASGGFISRNFVFFDIQGLVENFVFDKTWVTGGSQARSGRKLFRFKTGLMSGSDYHIQGVRGTFPAASGFKAIEDLDNGIQKDMWDHFSGNGIADFRYFSTKGSTTIPDPHPYYIGGLHGQTEYFGAEQPVLPYRVMRPGATKTADTLQVDSWAQLAGGAASLVLATGVFTATAHGLVEGQRIHLATGVTTTPNTGDTWSTGGTVCYVRNPTADTFQVSRVPDSNIVTFSAGPATMTVRYIRTATLAVTNAGVLDMLIQTADPAAPAANRVRLYPKLTGGKVALYARFPTGAVQGPIAVEP